MSPQREEISVSPVVFPLEGLQSGGGELVRTVEKMLAGVGPPPVPVSNSRVSTVPLPPLCYTVLPNTRSITCCVGFRFHLALLPPD